MPVMDIVEWLDEFSSETYIWYVKRLSGNDTLANKAHQAGPYLSKEFLFKIFPSLDRTDVKNPDLWFDLYIDSHSDYQKVRGVYYNNKFHGNPKNGRNETRITNFGGAASALLDPESTGALTVFAFAIDTLGIASECHVWVCDHETEEDLVEERVGPVEPGKFVIWSSTLASVPDLFSPFSATQKGCWLPPDKIPAAWLKSFPSGKEIIEKTIDLRPVPELAPDARLMSRRECEFEVFRSVEEAIELPFIKKGFDSVDAFVARAQTILQRRKSRAGRSLELHAKNIFLEEGLKEGLHFSHQPESESKKSPDFIFPSESSYKDPEFPATHLRMLAVKTTCKDRWRQVLSEANRIEQKHLLTLQEGVSENQFKEMIAAKVQLVVPKPLVEKFPKPIRPHLQTLESFIGDVRLLKLS